MRIERFDDPATFFTRVADFLLIHEAEHNLMLGFRGALERDPHAYGSEDPYLAAVVDGAGRVVAAAVRTPPHNLVLSRAADESVDALIAELAASEAHLPGVSGLVGPAERFARGWAADRGVVPRLAMAQGLYAATEVAPPEGVAGRMRPITEDDRPTVTAWMNAFYEEAMPGASEGDADSFVTRRLTRPDEGLVIWENDGPVSLAGFVGPTPNGIRVGPVYTPHGLRGHGYASALTAALTQELLDDGRRFCFLFTDLTNATSNSIYQRIGYRALGEVSQWSFDQP